MTNPWLQAQTQLQQVRKYLKISDDIFERLVEHDTILEKNLEIKLDNGQIRKFKAFRAQHNNALGPYKGGLRFHPQVSREEVMALSMWMTWKTAVAGLPLGGGKGGVVVDPRSLSRGELERLSKTWMRSFGSIIGSNTDVPAPDVNTNPEIMNWMVEECKVTKDSNECIATFTGKSLDAGGSQGRTEATGRGGFIVLSQLALKLGLKPQETTIAVQGIGNVGFWFAKLASEAGYKVVAISDSKGGITTVPEITDENWFTSIKDLPGLDVEKAIAFKQKHGGLKGFADTREVTNEELLKLPVTLIAPAALEGVIDEQVAPLIQADIVLELANGPTTAEADQILTERDIIVVPDVLANAGGVTVSYFEWLQNIKDEKWSEKKVNAQLSEYLEKAFGQVWSKWQQLQKKNTSESISMRIAAYALAVERVIKAMAQ